MKILLFAAFLFGTFNLKACECRFLFFKEETDYADIIFRGTVVSKVDSLASAKIYYSFAISKIWKGDIRDTIVIFSRNNPGACGIDLTLGKEYIIHSKNGYINQCFRHELYNIASSLPMLNYKYNLTEANQYGTDNSEVLNSFESAYFTSTFYERLDNMSVDKPQNNFTERKVAYFINDTLVSKKSFFEFNRMYEPNLYFYKFSKKQIEKTGGYIGIIYLDKKLKTSRMRMYKKLKQSL
jgi:hypothetical protein